MKSHTATFTIERNVNGDDNEIELVITACFYDDEIEILTIKDERGVEIEVSDKELDGAKEAIIKALLKEQEHYEGCCAEDQADDRRYNSNNY